MAQTLGKIFRNVAFGVTRCNVNWGPISKRSAVYISAAEYGPRPTPSGTVEGAHFGGASVTVSNIGPHDPEGGEGGVEFLLHVDVARTQDVMVTISVFEPVEEYRVV